MFIRWRLNDPGQEHAERWTKVHRESFHSSDLTACHIIVPEHAYIVDKDADIPSGAPKCKRCATASE